MRHCRFLSMINKVSPLREERENGCAATDLFIVTLRLRASPEIGMNWQAPASTYSTEIVFPPRQLALVFADHASKHLIIIWLPLLTDLLRSHRAGPAVVVALADRQSTLLLFSLLLAFHRICGRSVGSWYTLLYSVAAGN